MEQTKIKKYIDNSIDCKIEDLKKYFKDYINITLVDIEHLTRADTIKVLKEYPKRKLKLENYKEQLDSVKKYGLINKKTENLGVQTSSSNEDPIIKLEDKIKDLENIIKSYEFVLSKIERGFDMIRHDKYYSIVECRYIKGMSPKDIILELDISDRTYRRQHSRLLGELKSILIL